VTDKALDYLFGKIPIDEALEFEEVGSCRYTTHLDGFIITIGEKDYFISSFPKDDTPVSVHCITVKTI